MQLRVEPGSPQIPLPQIIVTVSEKNLRAILAKIDKPADENSVVRLIPELGTVLIVQGESNEDHYIDREPGNMGDEVEAAILEQQVKEDLENL